MSFPCMLAGCDWEFVTGRELAGHMKLTHPVEKPLPEPLAKKNDVSTKNPQMVSPELIKKRPIKAKYEFEGECPHCGQKVDTLFIEVANKTMLIAYCSSDKKQLQQVEVIPIDDQKNYTKIRK